MKHKVLIIGAGAIGSAIGKAAEEGGMADVSYWDVDKAKVPEWRELGEVAPGAELVFLCVPTRALRAAAGSVREYLSPQSFVITPAKGMEEQGNKFADELLGESLSESQPFGVFGGPLLADELSRGLEGSAVLGSKYAKCPAAEIIFAHSWIHFSCVQDLEGVALAGVLKNVYAIGLGIARGLGFGENAKGRMVSEAVSEMMEISRMVRGKQETMAGLAGLGDLVATGLSPYSKNHQAGHELAVSGKTDIRSEGMLALPLFLKRAPQAGELPFFGAIVRVVIGGAHPQDIFGKAARKI